MASLVERTPQAVTALALTWPEKATALTINSSVTYTQAGELLKDIKALRKEVDAAFNPIIAAAHKAHAEANSQKKRAETPLLEAEAILKRGLIAYESAQEALRRAEEQRLQALARDAEEARQIAEAAALEAEANATADAFEAAMIRQEAETVLAQPVVAPVVVVQSSVPKVAGISYREVWKFRVIDAAKVPREYLAVDEQKIGGVVRAMKGETQIAGIQVYAEKVASAGSR